MSKFHMRSFYNAYNGIKAFSLQCAKAPIHYTLALLAVAAGFAANLSLTEWSIIFLCIGAVIATEMVNEAIERLCDVTDPNHNPAIGHIKDISAGAVLVTAITALAVACCILLPPIYDTYI